MSVKPIPEGYHTATPYLVVRGADRTIEFLKRGFGAKLSFEPLLGPDWKVVQAAPKTGASHVMIPEATDQHPPMQSMVHLYVPNADSVYERAVAAGGTSAMAPTDMFYGDRAGSVKD